MTTPTPRAPFKNYITPAGLQRLRDELRFLLTRERPAVTEVVTWAAGNGDRSENADYQYGKRRLRQIDSRIRFLTKRIDAAHVVDPEAPRSGRAATDAFFGATVSYRNSAGVEQAVRIVGADEVDLDRRYISWASPLARALMKAGPGDRVTLRAPGGTEHLDIVDVCYQRIPIEPFSEPHGAESVSKTRTRAGGLSQWRSHAVNPAKNTICLWYDGGAEDAARFYARTFPDSSVGAVHRAPGDFPSGKQGDVLTVWFTVMGIPCLGLNGGPAFQHNEAFSFQVATVDQAETNRYWNAIVGNGGQESACGWCKDKWGVSWQITPIALTDAIADPDPAAAKRAFDAMMTMTKIDIATIEAARRG